METANPALIVGVFRDQVKANKAMDELKQGGFREDQIKSTAYNLNAVQEAQDSPELVAESSRIVVTVMAEGRDEDAVGILVNNGANNADLPFGTILDHGTIVSSEPETGPVTSEQQVDTAAGFSNDSFYSKGQLSGQPGDTVI